MVKVKNMHSPYSKGLTECKARTRFEIDFVLMFLVLVARVGHLLSALSAIYK
jgi:hypothetical protein